MQERQELLRTGAERLGIHLESGQLDLFQAYALELADWNQMANLTSITGDDEVQVKHFLDSLTVCLAVSAEEFARPLRVIDVGSGGGFPGLPLKIAFPEVQLHLVESVGKKTAFLEYLVGNLGLPDVKVHTGRAEVLGRNPELREAFDLALVRGVAKLPLLLEYTLPFCCVGGKVVALKHGSLENELDEAAHALEELGGRVAGIYQVELDGLTDNRVVLPVEKVSPTLERYPRRTGIPAKRPL